MAAFDPDAYLASAAPSLPAPFDPDAYLRQPSGAAPVTALGLTKAGGSGLAEGAIGIAGMGGDARDLHKYVGSKIGDALSISPETQAKLGTAYDVGVGAAAHLMGMGPVGPVLGAFATGPNSETIQHAIEQRVGKFYQPQNVAESAVKTIASFLPAAAIGGEESLIPRLLKQAVVPGLASEVAGQATKGTAAEPYARAGAAIGAGGLASLKSASKAGPAIDEVKAAAAAGYKDPAIAAVEIKPQAVTTLADSIAGDLKRQRINDRLAPQTHALLDDLKTPVNGPAHTIEDLETTRQRLGDLAGNFSNPVEAKAATTAIKALDTYSANIPQSHLLAGDAKAANAALTEARANYASAKTAEKVQEKLNNADLRAASTYSGGNLNNATRQNLRALLTSKKGQRGLTPDELQSIEDTVRGSTLGNVTRAAGKLLGGGGGMGALASGAAGHLLAGPLGLAVPLAGYGVKKIGDAITRSNSSKIVDQILARSPAGAAQAAQAAAIPADHLAMLKRLLLANSASLPLRPLIAQQGQPASQ